MTVKAVFFDMGGTLETFWYTPEMRLKATPDLQTMLVNHGIDLHLSDDQLYDAITHGLSDYHQWRLRTLEELPSSIVWRKYILADYPNDFPQLESIADDLMAWIETRYYQRQMRPEIPSVLEAIHSMGYKIGLISNVNSLGQVPFNLNQYGIRHFFNPIVLSSEYKRRKPDPAIFHYAARLSNTPTSECIYIGDRIARDIIGAKRAGFKLAIQIRHNFNHGESDEGATPDFVIDDMHELLEIIHQDIAPEKELQTRGSPRSTIRAVLFDADGVLYYRDNKDEILNSYIQQNCEQEKEISNSQIDELRHQAFVGQISFEQYHTKLFNLRGITDPSLVARGIQEIIDKKDKIQFFQNTFETLKLLKSHDLYLGIVTDTAQPLYVKIKKLERGGIGHLWDAITPSCEVGVQKPSPEIYQLTLQQLGISAHQAIFVGHKSSELDGAKRVGMHTVAFNYDPGTVADFYIHDFSELAQLAILD